eukprot:PhM_4_TR16462/c0_g1_i1/m.68652
MMRHTPIPTPQLSAQTERTCWSDRQIRRYVFSSSPSASCPITSYYYTPMNKKRMKVVSPERPNTIVDASPHDIPATTTTTTAAAVYHHRNVVDEEILRWASSTTKSDIKIRIRHPNRFPTNDRRKHLEASWSPSPPRDWVVMDSHDENNNFIDECNIKNNNDSNNDTSSYAVLCRCNEELQKENFELKTALEGSTRALSAAHKHLHDLVERVGVLEARNKNKNNISDTNVMKDQDNDPRYLRLQKDYNDLKLTYEALQKQHTATSSRLSTLQSKLSAAAQRATQKTDNDDDARVQRLEASLRRAAAASPRGALRSPKVLVVGGGHRRKSVDPNSEHQNERPPSPPPI